MGHVGSKTRSRGQILEKPFVSSGGQIFSPIVMKLVRMFVLMKSQMSPRAECDTILSAYTMYRHLELYHTQPWSCKMGHVG